MLPPLILIGIEPSLDFLCSGLYSGTCWKVELCGRAGDIGLDFFMSGSPIGDSPGIILNVSERP